MKTMIFTAAAMLSLGLGSAFADENGDASAITQFTQIPGFVAQPAPQSRSVATVQNAQMHVYASQSTSGGTWLFQPATNDGGNS